MSIHFGQKPLPWLGLLFEWQGSVTAQIIHANDWVSFVLPSGGRTELKCGDILL